MLSARATRRFEAGGRTAWKLPGLVSLCHGQSRSRVDDNTTVFSTSLPVNFNNVLANERPGVTVGAPERPVLPACWATIPPPAPEYSGESCRPPRIDIRLAADLYPLTQVSIQMQGFRG